MKVDVLQRGVESLSVTLQDTSRNVKSMANSLSRVSDTITDLSTTVTVVPNIAENVEKLLKLVRNHGAMVTSILHLTLHSTSSMLPPSQAHSRVLDTTLFQTATLAGLLDGRMS
jgi:hypothetical protein